MFSKSPFVLWIFQNFNSRHLSVTVLMTFRMYHINVFLHILKEKQIEN
jgi:hypothetical protein